MPGGETLTPPTPLAEAIEEAGLRKDWIARQLGVAPYTVSRWVSGTLIPGRVNQEKLGLILRRTPESLFGSASLEDTTQARA